MTAGGTRKAERQAARGHAALAVCLEGGDPEVAWALERRLFDHGYTVHVVNRPEGMTQAVRTGLEAGLVVIVTLTSSADWDELSGLAEGGGLVRYTPSSGASDEAAREIWVDLDASGRLSHSQGPLTGGAGI